MAIGARTSPELLAVGIVSGTAPKNWDGERTGTRVQLDTAGGPINVSFGLKNDGDVPPIGTQVVIVTSVYDGQNGASLSFVRFANPSDLDLILSASGLAASK